MRWPRLSAEVLPLLISVSPLIGVATTAFMARWNASLIRPMALSNSAMTLLLIGTVLWLRFPFESGEPSSSRTQVGAAGIAWLAESASPRDSASKPNDRGMKVRLSWTLDGLSAWSALLLSLTVWAVLCCPLQPENPSYASHCLGLLTCQSLLLASYFSADAISALVLLEMALVPVYLLVGRYGDENRRLAATTWWTWQMTGCTCSLLGVTLLAVSEPWMQMDLVATRGFAQFDTARLVSSIQQLLNRSETALQVWSHLAPWGAALLLLGIVIRLPLFPFQRWYQTTIVAAPAGLSAVIVAAFPLAALVGWMRLGMPLFGLNGGLAAAVLGIVSVVGSLQAGFMLQSHVDLKRILATISCVMLGLAGVGLSLQNSEGIRSAWLLVLVQGLAIPCGMLLVQILESRFGTRDLARLADRLTTSPRLRFVLTILLLGWAGIPITAAFSALYLQMSASSAAPLWMILAESIAILLVATAAFRALASTVRPSTSIRDRIAATTVPDSTRRTDVSGSELLALAPMLALLVLLNLAPSIFTKACEPTLQKLFPQVDQRTGCGTLRTPAVLNASCDTSALAQWSL